MLYAPTMYLGNYFDLKSTQMVGSGNLRKMPSDSGLGIIVICPDVYHHVPTIV